MPTLAPKRDGRGGIAVGGQFDRQLQLVDDPLCGVNGIFRLADVVEQYREFVAIAAGHHILGDARLPEADGLRRSTASSP